MQQHGPRRLWYAPWRTVCRCGWPDPGDCVIERAINAPSAQLYDLGEEYARAHLRDRGRWWARGAR